MDGEKFNGAELESYASAAHSDKKLVAIMNQGEVFDDKVNVDTKNVDCIYVDKDVFKEPIQNSQVKKTEKIKVKDVSRNSISFELKSAGKAVISIMDADGALVAKLVSENAQPGYNSLKWNSKNVPSGRYMVTIDHNGSVSGKNVVLK